MLRQQTATTPLAKQLSDVCRITGRIVPHIGVRVCDAYGEQAAPVISHYAAVPGMYGNMELRIAPAITVRFVSRRLMVIALVVAMIVEQVVGQQAEDVS